MLNTGSYPAIDKPTPSAFLSGRPLPNQAWRPWPWPARAQRLAVRGYNPARCATAMAHLSGSWQGAGAPNPGPQPPARGPGQQLLSPQRETGSEKRKKIARRKLPNIGPLLHHHHQPLSRRPALTLPPPPSVVFPSSQPFLLAVHFLPGPLEQSNCCHAPKDNPSGLSSVWCDLLRAAPDILHPSSIPESHFLRNHNSPACSAQYCGGKSFTRETPSDKLCPPPPAWQDGTPRTRPTPSSRCRPSRQP